MRSRGDGAGRRGPDGGDAGKRGSDGGGADAGKAAGEGGSTYAGPQDGDLSAASPSAIAPLVCPRCGARYPASERFCEECGLPLVHAEGESPPQTPMRMTARKIDPRYAEGELVRLMGTSTRTEGELIQGMLLEEGIPSMLRGAEVPFFLGAGRQEILVHASAVSASREALLQRDPPSIPGAPGSASVLPNPVPDRMVHPGWKVLAWMLAGLAIAAIILELAIGV